MTAALGQLLHAIEESRSLLVEGSDRITMTLVGLRWELMQDELEGMQDELEGTHD